MREKSKYFTKNITELLIRESLKYVIAKHFRMTKIFDIKNGKNIKLCNQNGLAA